MPGLSRVPSLPAWWLWVLGQAAVVAVYALEWRPAGGYPLPASATADLGLATVQLVLTAVIGPRLCGTWQQAARAFLAALPFVALADGLSGRPCDDAARLGLVTLLWAAAITPPDGPLPRQCVVVLTVGGPVLWYVAREYGGREARLDAWPAVCVPILGVCSTRLHTSMVRLTLPPTLLLAARIGLRNKPKV